jgi:dihydrofolate synthase/folylpolyglutamate synthase
MTYQETLSYIYSLGRFGMKPGLEKITALLHELHNPHERLQTVHVAGTNGKGSTAAFLATILAEGGYRVGLFSSPHLVSFTERFRINGAEISEDEVVALARRVMAVAPSATTFFEVVTAMACLWFAEEKVDLAVMEVGMGGRLDATNAMKGIVSIITPISIDHSQYLGSTIAEIAAEKAGIIKGGRPVVVSQQIPDALAVIMEECTRQESPLFCFGRDFTAEWEETGLAYRGLSKELSGLRPGIGGRYQAANVACALAAAEALDTLGFPLSGEGLRRGIERAAWPGRFEFVGDAPRILLDCAHNAAGAKALADSLSSIPRRRLLMVIGMMGDKDAGGILASLLPQADEIFAVAPALERACPSADLAALCRDRGGICTDAGTVAAGLVAARLSAKETDLILVCGSIFTVGEAKGVLLGRNFEPFRG